MSPWAWFSHVIFDSYVHWRMRFHSWLQNSLHSIDVWCPWVTTGNSDFANKDQKALGKGFAQHTASTVSTNSYLSSVFLSRTQQMVCRVSNLTLGKKKMILPSVFRNYTRQTYFPKKNSQHTIIVCQVFSKITLGKPIFQRKKIIFFSAYLCTCFTTQEKI